MHGNIRLSLRLSFPGVTVNRVLFSTRLRECSDALRNVAETAEALEVEERLVPLPKLTVEAARLPMRWLLRLPAEERVQSGACLSASAMADREAGSVSGGELRQRCMGSSATFVGAEPGMSIACERFG